MNNTTRRIVLHLLALLALGSLPAAAQNVSITINPTGPNNGAVNVIPSGQLCRKPGSTSCTVSFAAGTSVRIVANGAAGTSPPAVFSGGTGSAAMPIGSMWDATSGMFYGQPAPAFLGTFRLVFNNGRARIRVRIVVGSPQ